MSKKNIPPQVYKTESELKDEARAKQLAESEAEANTHKSEFQKKRENFWYHHKWHTIAGVVGTFLIIFFIRDMFFRTKPDATIIVISGGYISIEALENMATSFGEIATDFNGDGKSVIGTDSISLPKLESDEAMPAPDLTGGQQDMGNAMKLMAVVAAGVDPLYLLDEAAYEYLSAIGQEDGPNYQDNGIFDAYTVPASSLNVAFEGADYLDGMTFYLRSNFSDESYYEYCKQLLEAIAGE